MQCSLNVEKPKVSRTPYCARAVNCLDFRSNLVILTVVEINRMPRKSQANPREAVILGILLNGERFGREIRDEYEKRTSDAMPVGSLYTTLERMEEYGFVTSREGEPSDERNSHRRRYFKLTGEGRRALEAAEMMSAAIRGKAVGRGE